MLMKLLKNFLMPISKVHQTCIAREIISLLDHPFLPTFYTSFQVPVISGSLKAICFLLISIVTALWGCLLLLCALLQIFLVEQINQVKVFFLFILIVRMNLKL
ncbi:hypothetical protein KIW84_063757 [Lathyrus oleraceus]|uniref:Uncharacterized protein n=1 Tax=Pisum sativum TaxID=3888 RepID=A0A9D4WCG7_PEA|nr:hypothetical protein KIW84_063757 [Pisum sativum]